MWPLALVLALPFALRAFDRLSRRIALRKYERWTSERVERTLRRLD